MNIQAVLLGLTGAMNYLCGFYGLNKIRFHKKWIPLHILLSIILSVVIVNMNLYTQMPVLYLYGACLELLLAWGTVYLLVDGDFFRNYFLLVLWSWSANLFSCGVFFLLDYDFFYKVYLQLDYREGNPWEMLAYALCPILILPLFRKVILKVPKNRPIWNVFFKFAFLYMVVTSVAKCAFHLIDNNGMQFVSASQLTLAVVLFLLVVVWIIIERVRQLKQQRKNIVNEYEMLQKRYESAVELTRNYRLLRHEWNHQLSLQNGAKTHISSEDRRKYLSKYEDSIKDFLQIPISGNIHVDMELYYLKRFCDENHLMVDMVVSPLNVREEFGIPVAYILQECVIYVEKMMKRERKKPLWVHLDIRCVGELLVMQMEMKVLEKMNRLHSFTNAFFSGESVADFSKTNQITEDRNGGFILSEDKELCRVLVMLPITEKGGALCES